MGASPARPSQAAFLKVALALIPEAGSPWSRGQWGLDSERDPVPIWDVCALEA